MLKHISARTRYNNLEGNANKLFFITFCVGTIQGALRDETVRHNNLIAQNRKYHFLCNAAAAIIQTS